MKKRENNYVFIDAQNMYIGTKSSGWLVDAFKLRIYLKDKYNISKAFWFTGYLPKNQKFYDLLKTAGFIPVFKEISKKNDGTPKGNIDVELTLYTVDKIDEYDKAVIITSDGDFSALVYYLIEKNKFYSIISPNRKHTSYLLRKSSGDKYSVRYLEDIKSYIKNEKRRPRD